MRLCSCFEIKPTRSELNNKTNVTPFRQIPIRSHLFIHHFPDKYCFRIVHTNEPSNLPFYPGCPWSASGCFRFPVFSFPWLRLAIPTIVISKYKINYVPKPLSISSEIRTYLSSRLVIRDEDLPNEKRNRSFFVQHRLPLPGS